MVTYEEIKAIKEEAEQERIKGNRNKCMELKRKSEGMKCQLVLRKFDLNLGLLKSKINALKGVVESDFIKDRLNVEIDNYRKLKYFKEIERILIFEKDMTSFSQESLRESVLRIAGKFKDAKIKEALTIVPVN